MRGRKTKKMVKLPCEGPGCESRRADTPRGKQYVSVPTMYHGPALCSIECHMYWEAANPKVKENN